ncbi:MAG: spondin domain-containing protein [Woeseiaceae bacterium]
MLIDLQKSVRLLAVGCVALIAAACDSDNNGNGGGNVITPPAVVMSTFEVTVTNLTNAQPLSPIAVIAHQNTFPVFTIGSPASAGLETLAEGGDNSALLAAAMSTTGIGDTASGAAPIGPAGSETVSLTMDQNLLGTMTVSVSTMLVNTNDAITGINAVPLRDMQVGDSVTMRSIAYDAGTEANTESAAHIPGPAGGGEGFNAARDDIADRVAMHSGVVGQDDGFATSDLTGQHRFDNPVALVRIERIN